VPTISRQRGGVIFIGQKVQSEFTKIRMCQQVLERKKDPVKKSVRWEEKSSVQTGMTNPVVAFRRCFTYMARMN